MPYLSRDEEIENVGRARTKALGSSPRHLPTFIVIGAKKCGTGALRQMLPFHSKIKAGNFLETSFFDTR